MLPPGFLSLYPDSLLPYCVVLVIPYTSYSASVSQLLKLESYSNLCGYKVNKYQAIFWMETKIAFVVIPKPDTTKKRYLK